MKLHANRELNLQRAQKSLLDSRILLPEVFPLIEPAALLRRVNPYGEGGAYLGIAASARSFGKTNFAYVSGD
jgi:hypothetical protein